MYWNTSILRVVRIMVVDIDYLFLLVESYFYVPNYMILLLLSMVKLEEYQIMNC